jgi:hypothetical protein
MILHFTSFFFFNNHDFSLCYSYSTYALMYFVKCFRKHEDLLSFCDKNGKLIGCLGILVLSPNCQRGSLLVFLLG